jgi:type IV pilus assembly protein PilV
MQLPARQRGFALTDALVSIAVFGLGITGLAGLQATLLAQNTQSSYRVQAAAFANSLVGIALSDTANLQCYAAGNGCHSAVATATAESWRREVVATLPGAADAPPQLELGNDGMFTVRLFWKLPREDVTHNYVLITQAPIGT